MTDSSDGNIEHVGECLFVHTFLGEIGVGGVASAKREAQAQILDMLQTLQSDFSLSQSQ